MDQQYDPYAPEQPAQYVQQVPMQQMVANSQPMMQPMMQAHMSSTLPMMQQQQPMM